MQFVLSFVLRPVGEALHGRSTVLDPVSYRRQAAETEAVRVLIEHGMRKDDAGYFGHSLYLARTSADVLEPVTGITFRIDPAGRAPNSCPCCGRLVKWGDHAFAGSDDAYCLGCYTWDFGSEPCLPENTAHPHKED